MYKRQVYDIFTDLYGIRDLLCNPRLHFRAVLLDITEYRYISEIKGSRKKVRRADRIPFTVADIIELRNPCDAENLIPAVLNRELDVYKRQRKCLYTQVPIHANAFTCCLYYVASLHENAFICECLYTC